MFKTIRIALVALSATLPLAAANVLYNPSFELGGSGASSSSYGALMTSIPAWLGWNGTGGTMASIDLLPTTLPLPDAGSTMLEISGGAYTQMDNHWYTGGSGTFYAGAWVYLLSGTAGLQLPGGATAWDSTPNQWVYLTTSAADLNATQVNVFAGYGGGDFYVDLVTVDTNPITPEQLPSDTPEPASLALVAGAGLAFAARRYTRRQS